MSTGYNDRLKAGIWRGKVGDKEYRDNEKHVQQQCDAIANLIRSARRVVAFTGAGICTSVGIPDFRGPQGVWTAEKKKIPPPAGVPFAEARPSVTHMALVALMAAGRLTHVVSQNVDGLHLRSGIPRARLSELHGNIFIEVCHTCGREYVRDFDVEGMGLRPTGRSCDDCGGPLHDRTYDWDTDLPDDEFTSARAEHAVADVCLCLGTSLRIQPANRMVLLTRKPHKHKPARGSLVIVNYQKTTFDHAASIRVFAGVDEVMIGVMSRLGISIPTWHPGFTLDLKPHTLPVPALQLHLQPQSEHTSSTSTSLSSSTSTFHSLKRSLDSSDAEAEGEAETEVAADADVHPSVSTATKRQKLDSDATATISTTATATLSSTSTATVVPPVFSIAATADVIRRSGRVTRSMRLPPSRIK